MLGEGEKGRKREDFVEERTGGRQVVAIVQGLANPQLSVLKSFTTVLTSLYLSRLGKYFSLSLFFSPVAQPTLWGSFADRGQPARIVRSCCRWKLWDYEESHEGDAVATLREAKRREEEDARNVEGTRRWDGGEKRKSRGKPSTSPRSVHGAPRGGIE